MYRHMTQCQNDVNNDVHNELVIASNFPKKKKKA